MSKLSREELITEMDYLISISRKSKQKSSPLGKHHVPMLKAIKSLLTPIPDDKLKEFIDEWMYYLEWKDKDELKHDYIPRMLQAYEAIRGGGE